MSDYREVVEQDRRLVLLRLLEQAPNYEANSSVMQMALTQYGHHISRDLLHTDLTWLDEQGLVSVIDVSTVRVARLSARGLDVATGRASAPGVKKPGPGA